MRVKITFESRFLNTTVLKGTLLSLTDNGIRMMSDSGDKMFFPVSDPDLIGVEFERCSENAIIAAKERAYIQK